jgi:RNA:NAD 2'-phosphotransferase (TPT1/KptA family)/5-formyltetrahydrofolate cyclo-ligase
MEATKISKFLSYILRHNPEKYGLKLNEKGFAAVRDVLKIISKKFKINFTNKDLQNLIASQERPRFQIKDDKIRANYGHSKVKITYSKDEYVLPPDFLYHGTSPTVVHSILKEGLKPKARRFVHLCQDLDEAYKVGRRHTDRPIVLVVKAKEAYNQGLKFIKQDEIYLCEFIPPRFILPLDDAKAKIRERIWHLMEKNKLIYSSTCFGKIPNFRGKEEAAALLAKQEFFKNAECIFSAPDGALSKIREIILKEGKVLVVALPRMRGFVEIKEKYNIKEASTIKGFTKFGKPISSKRKIDLFIQGAVAVDKLGNRLGKGSGFGDKEWSYFQEKGLLKENCQVVCVVHDLQVLNENIDNLMQAHDKKVDYIITPTSIIKVPK